MASCAYLILSGAVELSKVKEGTAEIAEYIKRIQFWRDGII